MYPPGYTDNTSITRRSMRTHSFLRKPFTPDGHARNVRAVLANLGDTFAGPNQVEP